VDQGKPTGVVRYMVQDELKSLVNYDCETGVFTWKVKRWRCAPGDIIGTPDKDGYLTVKINQTRYKLHRLAWLYVHGEWPKNCIDHVNGLKTDNRISNLRDVTKRENSYNVKKASRNNKHSGLLGVSYVATQRYNIKNRWLALIRVDGKSKRIGSYSTAQEAHEAYLAAKRIYHSTCTI
jgi:hypothetical protein